MLATVRRGLAAVALAACAPAGGGMVAVAPAAAQAPPAPDRVPPELEGVDLVDRSGERVPGDIRLIDGDGREVRFADFLNRGRPVLLQLVYYNCPMLCTLVLNGYLDAAKQLDWIPGRDYTVVTVSFDHRDRPALAAEKKKTHVAALGKPGAEEGWQFLVGDSAQVRALADAVGFRYRYDPQKREYAHAAGMFVLTPEGRISRTLYGIEYPARDLRLALVEASQGMLGTPFDRLLMYCYQYDPKTHRYAVVARNVMKLGGVLIVAALGAFLALLWRRERRRARPAAAGAA